jgi:opacity protein-like surface antigen
VGAHPMKFVSGQNRMDGWSCRQVSVLMIGLMTAVITSSPSLAQAHVFNPTPERQWTGIYVGGATGLSTREFSVVTTGPRASSTMTAARFSGFVGAQVQRGAVVVGLEAEAMSVSASRRMKLVFAPNDVVTAQARSATLSTGRLRMGYAFGDALLHASVGLGIMTTRLQATDGISTAVSNIDQAVWSLAVGADYALTRNLFVRTSLMTTRSLRRSVDAGGLGTTSTQFIDNAATIGLGILF